MRRNFGAKPWLYPMPVLIIGTYGADGTPNAMNAAWGGISEENEIFICVSDDHKTTENFQRTGAFTVSVATAETLVAADFVGIVSGNDAPDKLAKTGWHAEKGAFVNAPLFAELPLALECEVVSYDRETCRLFGRILNVSADERVLDGQGRIDAERLAPIAYDPVAHVYRALGAPLGAAFHAGKALK